ncbi:Steroid 17-alpha-hydroxylase/17 [Acropora cervicornis]|uniref:Steroid 17-alpha-hydroxylase/17 n=1 Tax=Acropora cervicornis TaxID=6130 RepID=A0AAD9QFZ5_ACRCE|nr:Steroid 17-alpha-hydroxylase/17 [Acropora cervicornis]
MTDRIFQIVSKQLKLQRQTSGCEAIPTALRWLIVFLVNYPGCQRDIQHELDEEIGWGKMPKLTHNLPILRAKMMEAHFFAGRR